MMNQDMFVTLSMEFVKVANSLGNDILQPLGITSIEFNGDVLSLDLEFIGSESQRNSQHLQKSEEETSFFEDPNLQLDSSTISSENRIEHEANGQKYVGRLEVIFDEAFEIPVPFLRLWRKDDGSVVNWQEVQRVLPKIDCCDANYTMEDRTQYSVGTWMIGVNPLTGCSSWTLHLCDLARKFELVCHSNGTIQFPMLWWINIIFPTMGIPISPSLYVAIEREFITMREST
jgi:hypothetical protein